MEKVVNLTKGEEERAQELIEKYLFIDASQATHQDEFNDALMEQMNKSGLDCVHLTISPAWDMETTLKSICDWHNIVYNLGEEKIKIVTKTDEILKSKEEGRKTIILGLQDSPIGTDLRLLEILKLCRVTIFQLSYNHRNLIADGAGEKTNGKLSNFGVQVVEELNRLGMIVDLSHVGIASTFDAMEMSKSPVIFSHVGVRTLCDHFRCITDEQIKALAEKRGMIGIVALAGFLKSDGYEKGTSIEDYLNHLDYIVELIGIDFVGIGSDIRTQEEASSFTHHKGTGRLEKGIIRKDLQKKPPAWAGLSAESKYPKGMVNVGEFGNITRGLVSRGYSDPEIKKILGGNFLRVFREVCG